MNETGTVSSTLLVSAKNKFRNTSKQTFEQRPNARKRLRLRSSKVVFHEKKILRCEVSLNDTDRPKVKSVGFGQLNVRFESDVWTAKRKI
jgi:hypothetical protein